MSGWLTKERGFEFTLEAFSGVEIYPHTLQSYPDDPTPDSSMQALNLGNQKDILARKKPPAAN